MGLWRYSMAIVIVLAAMLDVVWWVPAHERAARPDGPAVQVTTPRCRRAQIRREMAQLQAEIAALTAQLAAIDARLAASHAEK